MPTQPERIDPASVDRPLVDEHASATSRLLRTELERQIAYFNRSRERDKRKAQFLQVSTVALSATITVLLGIRAGDEARNVFANIALTCGAIVTVLAAFDAFYNHRQLWIIRAHTVAELNVLRRRWLFHEAGTHGKPERIREDTVAEFAAELNRILAADEASWQRLRKANTFEPSRSTSFQPSPKSPINTSNPDDPPTS